MEDGSAIYEDAERCIQFAIRELDNRPITRNWLMSMPVEYGEFGDPKRPTISVKVDSRLSHCIGLVEYEPRKFAVDECCPWPVTTRGQLLTYIRSLLGVNLADMMS